MFGVQCAVNKVNSGGGHSGVMVLFIWGDQAGWLFTSVMRLRLMGRSGRVYLNVKVNLETLRQTTKGDFKRQSRKKMFKIIGLNPLFLCRDDCIQLFFILYV